MKKKMPERRGGGFREKRRGKGNGRGGEERKEKKRKEKKRKEKKRKEKNRNLLEQGC